MKKILSILLLFVFVFSFAQENKELEGDDSILPLKWNLNPSGTQSITFGMWAQIWARQMEMNPGTKIGTVPQDHFTDIGLRRFRLTANFQLSKDFQAFLQLGVNNQSFNSGGGTGTGANGLGKRAQVYFHDAYVSYDLKKYDSNTKLPFSISLGAGLHAWNGVSRLTNASTNKMLTFDIPVYNFPGIEITDQMGRQFGVFVHGEIEKLSYRMNINRPFQTSIIPTSNNVAVDNNGHNKFSYAGYFAYQFKDRESQATSFLAGTYLGEKSIFNIGFGFYNNAKGTATLENETLKQHDINVYGLDVFYEQPLGIHTNKQVLSVYSVLYKYQMGPNYIRTQGLLNPGFKDDAFEGSVAAEGFGNNKFFLGTGNIWHTTVAYMFAKFKNTQTQIQPYFTYARKDLEAIKETANFYDVGFNLLFKGHNSKLSFQYSSQPLHYATDLSFMKRVGEWKMCFQIYL